jgi:hypothetical protein
MLGRKKETIEIAFEGDLGVRVRPRCQIIKIFQNYIIVSKSKARFDYSASWDREYQ